MSLVQTTNLNSLIGQLCDLIGVEKQDDKTTIRLYPCGVSKGTLYDKAILALDAVADLNKVGFSAFCFYFEAESNYLKTNTFDIRKPDYKSNSYFSSKEDIDGIDKSIAKQINKLAIAIEDEMVKLTKFGPYWDLRSFTGHSCEYQPIYIDHKEVTYILKLSRQYKLLVTYNYETEVISIVEHDLLDDSECDISFNYFCSRHLKKTEKETQSMFKSVSESLRLL